MTEKDRTDLQACADYHREKRVAHSRSSSRTGDWHDGRAEFHERLRRVTERVLAEVAFDAE